MPTLDENLKQWNSAEGWERSEGDRWSDPWGNEASQWHFVILPRIREFLPARRILEIAPGRGRWTQFLKDRCDRLTVVDLSPYCIEVCKRRFSSSSNLSYLVNDGKSFPDVADRSVDFVFSFDSLVHAESDVMEEYLREIARVLAPDGVAFLHHSNSGVFAKSAGLMDRITSNGPIGRALHSLFPFRLGWRARSVTAELIQEKSQKAGLQCFRQERISWETGRYLRDAISTLTPRGSVWDRSPVLIDNPHFAAEAQYVRLLSTVYSTHR